jgi:MoxR-like ATPase
MSDVAIHNLVQKRNELKNEIAKIIVVRMRWSISFALYFSGGHALLWEFRIS